MNIHEFDLPANFVGEQLKKELNCENVFVDNGKLFIVGELTKAQAQKGIDSHIPAPVVVESTLDKLGISLAELKQLLA